MAEPESTITGSKPKAPPAKKSKTPSAEELEAAAERKLSKQVTSDEAAEKADTGTSPGDFKKQNKLSSQILKDTKAETTLTAAGMGHPDAKALIAAGIPAQTVKALATAYAPSHPAANPAYAAATTGASKGTGVTADPTNPSQYAADVLTEAGLPDTATNEGLLETQMTEEGMPGGEDNPLATTVKEPGSTSVNSAGVQEYPTLAEGAQAEAQTLKQKNMSSIYDALTSGSETPSEYAAGLANSSYEGYDPAANAAYANAYLSDSGDPTTQFNTSTGGGGTGGESSLATDALSQASSSNLFSGLSSTIPQLGTQGATSSLQSALQGIGQGSSASTLAANTSDAPGSPDQTNSQTQQTNVNPAATYQAQLAALLGKNVQAGTAGKTNG